MAMVSRFMLLRFWGTGVLLDETVHLIDYPMNIRLCGSKACNTSAHHRGVTQLRFRHPGDLALVKCGQKFGRDEPFTRKTNQGKWSGVHNAPPGSFECLAEYVPHTSLVLDHLRIA